MLPLSEFEEIQRFGRLLSEESSFGMLADNALDLRSIYDKLVALESSGGMLPLRVDEDRSIVLRLPRPINILPTKLVLNLFECRSSVSRLWSDVKLPGILLLRLFECKLRVTKLVAQCQAISHHSPKSEVLICTTIV